MHLAHGHACQEFADALAEVNSWEPERFDMHLFLLQELECCVRATVARGKEKLAFLDSTCCVGSTSVISCAKGTRSIRRST